jgi:thiol-disulfide isomerase/thioredoxin
MKRIFTLILALMGMMFLFTQCDKVEEPYYEIIEEEDVTVVFPELNPQDVYRKVLIEEFTGHRCTNCPAGHQILDQLHQQYGDTLVTIGIHYGSLAKPLGSLFSYDFRTEPGNAIGADYGIDAIPAAIVNMVYESGGWPRSQWANVIRDVDRSQVVAAIQLINEYNADSKVLKANAKVTLLKEYSNPLQLALYLVEDGIVKPQKDGNQDIEDYVHNHVLRAALNGAFGMVLNDGNTFNVGESATFASGVDMSATDWNPNNCYVVAVLFNPTVREVVQVEKLDVISR